MAIPHDIDARRYYRVAMQRLDEADLILKKLELYQAAVYLGGYAVECALKALLIANAPATEHPRLVQRLKRDFGHSLPLLQEGLRQRGVRIPREVLSGLTLAGGWSPELRYNPTPGNERDAQRFMVAVRVVVAWADRSM